MVAANFIEIKPGSEFNLLTVVSLSNNRKNRQACWLCDCKCGTKNIEVRSSQLRSGRAKSCGCLRKKAYNWKGYGEISQSYWYMQEIHAKTRDREFSITIQEAWHLFIKQNRCCAISGVELSFTRDYRFNKLGQNASLDRIDSNKGYILDNVQWVHKDVNKMKGSLSDHDFVQWCEIIASFQRRQ